MAAIRKPPRLKLRERKDGKPVWVIKDGDTFLSTRTQDRSEAERALDMYLLSPSGDSSHCLIGRPKRLRRAAHKALRGAQFRSKQRGSECELTLDDVLDMIRGQGGVCSITGIAFQDAPSTEGRRKPYAPSLDRIDNGKGYTRDNVRVVLSIVNTAKGDYSDEEFMIMCSAVAGRPMRTITQTKPHDSAAA